MDTSRIDKIKKMGFDPHTVYYHGTDKEFDNLIPSKRGALNYGIYISNIPATANTYAGSFHGARVLPLHLRLKKGIEVSSIPFTKDMLVNMLNKHPNSNKDSFIGRMKIIASGYGGYNNTNPLEHIANKIANKTGLDAINSITDNNIYDSPKQAFEEITKHTGYNHIVQDRGYGEKWISMWHPEDVKSINAKFEKEYSNDLMEDFRVNAGKFIVKEIVKYFVNKEIENKKAELKQKVYDTIFGKDDSSDNNVGGNQTSSNISNYIPPSSPHMSNTTPVIRIVHKQRSIPKMRSGLFKHVKFHNIRDDVNEDAVAANVVANTPTIPVVSVVNQQRIIPKIRKNKLLDVDNEDS